MTPNSRNVEKLNFKVNVNYRAICKNIRNPKETQGFANFCWFGQKSMLYFKKKHVISLENEATGKLRERIGRSP